ILGVLRKKSRAPAKIRLTIACALPKKAKFDDIVDKLTQLGVDGIIPLNTKRVIVKIDKKKEVVRLERWRKIAMSAAKQSQRASVPVVGHLKSIEEVLKEGDYDLKLIPHLSGKRRSLKEAIEKASPKNILILIGPEGDFTDEEVALAVKYGCVPVSLGELVLRVDTAAIAVASFVRLLKQ
ncbi:MAG: RNA methyltransferase, partial [Candidatus Omnitrophica bacterium]|nr:RNA methyltransferase [Candidatus Omnitrophota bacterium]